MINGISLASKVKIIDKQKLWNLGVRFVYADTEDNSSLLQVTGECEYQGFKFGGLKRLRYFPGAGTGESQAFNFADQLAHIPTAKLPPVLEITNQDGPLPELNEWLLSFFKHFPEYSKGAKTVVIKASKSVIDGLKPVQAIQDYVLSNGLWITSPSNPISISPFKYYTLRGYTARLIEGTMAEWVDIPGSIDQFKAWVAGSPLRFATTEVPPVVVPGDPPEEPGPTDHDMLVAIYKMVKRIEGL